MFSIFFGLCFSKVRDDDFTGLIGKDKYVFVNFYCGSCPHSQESIPIWEEISEYYQNINMFVFYKLECDRYSAKCHKLGAEKFPQFSLFLPGTDILIPYNRDIDKDQFVKWVKQNTGIIVQEKNLSDL